MEALHLTWEDGMEKVWFVDEHGRLSGGAEAINKAMGYCWWARPFTSLYYLPGVRQIEEWGYQWLANNRNRLPGSTPSCKIDP
jgi:predicted DCC family thiol-disulfide oxidoreductase YuxK